MRLLDSAMLSNAPQHHMREERGVGLEMMPGREKAVKIPEHPPSPINTAS